MNDTVYRQDAIDAVISLCDDCDSDYCGYCRVNIDGGKDARKVLEDLPSAQPDPKWIPCTVINQCYIPKLKDIDYKGVLFTYETITGRRLVKIAWVKRGRIIGKQMKGTPVAYKLLPEPYRAERRTND